MDTLLKHGSHNQASHNPHKGGTSDLPEGWSRRDTKAELRQRIGEWARSDEERERLVGERDTWDVYDGPNGSKVIVDRNANIPASAVKEQLETVATLQSIAPVNRLQVEIADRAFEGEGMPASVKGMTKLHGEVIYLRPTAVTEGVDHSNGQLMPAFQGKPQLYSTVHEYGHVLDKRSAATAREDHDNVFLTSNQGGASRYAYDGDAEGNRGREAFAEAWTGWVSSTGQSTKPFVRYFADKYQWDAGGDGRPPSAGFAKQEADVFLADTFTAEGAVVRPAGAIIEAEGVAKSVIVAFEPGLRPVLKHGDHDQSSHGRRGGGGSSLKLDGTVAQSIVERVRANGGLSVNMVDGSEPTKGYMVAMGGSKGAIMDADEFYDPVRGPEALGSFMKSNRELSEGSYLGLWHNQADGKVYLDVSENIMDQATAITAGRERDQISIWDVANFEEIDTGGTGAVGKAVAGSETAGPEEYDGSGDRRIRKDAVGEVRGRGVVVFFEPGLRPVLKHGSHDQSAHGRRGGGSGQRFTPGDTGPAAEAARRRELTDVPGRYTPSGSETMPDRPSPPPAGRREGAKTWTEEYADQRDAIANALVNGDFDSLNIAPSRLAQSLGAAQGAVMRRIDRVAERVGIKRRKRWSFTEDEATRLRESYYEKYGRPGWMDKAVRRIRKHLGGAHDQKSHGRGGGGSGWGDRQKEIDAMASAGPSRESLEGGVSGGMSDDELRERISEDFAESIEEDARTYVEERMADEGWVDNSDDPDYEEPLIGKTYQEEFDERLEDVRSEVTDSYVDNYGEEYRNQATEDLGLDADSFNEVYGTSHTGMTPDGREVTLQAQVENVYVNKWDESIDVDGTIYDADGNWAGEFQRKFSRDDSGDMVVEHALLRIEDDYQGTGFSKVFNRTAENYYISHGVDKVDIHAALDVGGYAWAKQGFDWAPKGGATGNVKRQFDEVLDNPSLPGSVRRSGVELRARLDLPSSDPDYPTPREVASWGYVQGASTWPGKQTLLGSDWYGQKSLTPSGPRQSTTQQEAAAAVAELPGQMAFPGVVP